MSCAFNLEVKAEVNAQMSGGGMSDTAMALTIQMLTEKKIVAAMGQKAGVSASRVAMEAALKQGMERKMAEAAAKRAAEFAAKAATKAMAGPVGAVLMAAQAAGMVIDIWDPVNLAMPHTQSELDDNQAMVAGAMKSVLGSTQICSDPSFTREQEGSATQPQVMCFGGSCMGVYNGAEYPALKPPASAKCRSLAFPSVLAPADFELNPQIPPMVGAVMNSADFNGALLLHETARNASIENIFVDPRNERAYRDAFNADLNNA